MRVLTGYLTADSGRVTVDGVRRWAAAIGGMALLVIVNMAAYGHDAQPDLSSSGRFSLSPESRALASR